MCLPRELVMANLTSASRNWLFTHLYSVVTWIMSLICTNLTMTLCVTWFIYGVFWLKCADFQGKVHFTVVFCFLIPLFYLFLVKHQINLSNRISSSWSKTLDLMLKQFVKSVGDFEGTLLFPLKRGKCQWYFFFWRKVFLKKVGSLYMVSIQRWVGAFSKPCKTMKNSCCVRVFNAKL